ncbi:unnamed protein product [Chironomus riparius]|uniref:Uncharacterized protein n=1 Tax=Chironomus riparius TaxID=315576 RepID=A0A9N9RR93_9DIPT|nr:unnamed protein product [Chironomus riparius]
MLSENVHEYEKNVACDMLPSHLSMLMSLLNDLITCHIGMCSLSMLKKVP